LLITTFLGYGVLSLFEPVPLDRVYLLKPRESLDIGDRQLTAYKPPTFDNPATTGLYDSKSRALFSSDCFGAGVESRGAGGRHGRGGPAGRSDAMDQHRLALAAQGGPGETRA
jgi:hypothetical protein